MKTLKSTTVIALLAAVAMFAVSCGGGNSKKQKTENATETTAQTETKAGNDKDTGKSWSDSDLTKETPKPNGTVQKTLVSNELTTVIYMNWTTKADADVYITKAKTAGFNQDWDHGTDTKVSWSGRKGSREVERKTVYLEIEFADGSDHGSIKIERR